MPEVISREGKNLLVGDSGEFRKEITSHFLDLDIKEVDFKVAVDDHVTDIPRGTIDLSKSNRAVRES